MITTLQEYINEMAKFKYDNNTNRKAGKQAVFNIDPPTDDSVLAKDGVANYKKTLNTDWLEMKLISKQPFFVMGHAGWGKTSIIKNVAKEAGLTVITVYLDKALPEDLGGIPIVTKSGENPTVNNALPKWAQYIYEHPDDDFLVFFDEMNQASPDVQNALMPILLESEIGGIKFDNVWFGAAGNYSEENASISDLSAPLRSRFIKEHIWNENWEDAFEHITEKYKDKLPKSLLDTVINNIIYQNPRELDKMLEGIGKIKNSAKEYSLDSIFSYISHFNKMDKNAETKKIAEEVFNFLYKKQDEEKVSKKPQVKRKLLNDEQINQIVKMIKQKGFINDKGEITDLSGDKWIKYFNLPPEEVNIIKNKLAQK